MTELKPCPFCGGEAVLERSFPMGLEGEEWYYIYCSRAKNSRGNQCPANPVISKAGDNAKERVIEAWNTRSNPWHTGTPTEEGWYLLHYPECKEQPYELAQWNGEHFAAVKPFHAIVVRIEASSVPYWQKIEER